MPFVDYKADEKDKRCRHPEHDPPGHIVLKPGTYTYQCPACGQKQTFRVTKPVMDVGLDAARRDLGIVTSYKDTDKQYKSC